MRKVTIETRDCSIAKIVASMNPSFSFKRDMDGMLLEGLDCLHTAYRLARELGATERVYNNDDTKLLYFEDGSILKFEHFYQWFGHPARFLYKDETTEGKFKRAPLDIKMHV